MVDCSLVVLIIYCVQLFYNLVRKNDSDSSNLIDTSAIGHLVLGNVYRQWLLEGRRGWVCSHLDHSLLFNLRMNVFDRSPVSNLQIRYDQPSSSGLESLPPVAVSIEQLLERQWSEGQQFLLEQGTPSDSK